MAVRDLRFKIVAAGATSVGKSSIIKRLVSGSFECTTSPTTGANFFTYSCPVNGETVTLQIWDTAGQERFHSISKSYFRSAVGAILVYDITSLDSFDSLMDWLPDLQALALPNAYILLIGNKADLEDQKAITPQDVDSLAKKYPYPYWETSAKTGKGIMEAFQSLAERLCREVPETLAAVENQGVQLSAEPQRTGSCCLKTRNL
jgi:small GTP-binding protein